MVAHKLPMAERTFERDFQPTGDYVLLRLHNPKQTAGGLALPEGTNLDPPKATVVRVGPGVLLDDGTHGAMDLKAGDVVFPLIQGGLRAPLMFDIGERKYCVCAAAAVVGKVRDGAAKNGDAD